MKSTFFIFCLLACISLFSTASIIKSNLFQSPIVKVGDNMVDANLIDENGNTKSISDYLDKYVLIDFWAYWCQPCIMAFPEMKEISEIYRDKLTIISISIDTDAEWKTSMAAHDMPWVNVRDPKASGGLATTYSVTALPTYVLISPEGKVVDKWMGSGEGSLKRKVSENIK